MTQLTDRKKCLKMLDEIDKNKNDYLFVHYACEKFNKETGESPRIASIAIRNFDTGQTQLFALHKSAESLLIPFNEIGDNYDRIEKEMLKEYFKVVGKNLKKIWIHWNMRDTNYGFMALEHRYKVLGGTPKVIDDEQKLDLSNFFVRLYGKGYAAHPRLEKLIGKNFKKADDFLSGTEEAALFPEHRFNEIMMSTSRKVDIFSNFLNLAINRQLKVYTPKIKWYGTTIKGYWSTFRNSAFFVPISWSFSALGGAIISHLLEKWLK